MSAGQSGRGAGAPIAPHLVKLSIMLAMGTTAALAPAASGTAAGEASWIFRRGTFTHDRATGARVAQYARTPPVEALDDERTVTARDAEGVTVRSMKDDSSMPQFLSWPVRGREDFEMMKQRYLRAFQDDLTGEIKVALRSSEPVTAEEILRGEDEDLDEDLGEQRESSAGNSGSPP